MLLTLTSKIIKFMKQETKDEYVKRYSVIIKDKLDKVYGNRVPLKMVYAEMDEVINQIYDDGYEANHLF